MRCFPSSTYFFSALSDSDWPAAPKKKKKRTKTLKLWTENGAPPLLPPTYVGEKRTTLGQKCAATGSIGNLEKPLGNLMGTTKKTQKIPSPPNLEHLGCMLHTCSPPPHTMN